MLAKHYCYCMILNTNTKGSFNKDNRPYNLRGKESIKIKSSSTKIKKHKMKGDIISFLNKNNLTPDFSRFQINWRSSATTNPNFNLWGKYYHH